MSNLGLMFFGDQTAALRHMRESARRGARMVAACRRSLEENPWMGVPMAAAAKHLPPRPPAKPNAPGMFAYADPTYVADVLTAAGWSAPERERFACDLDIAAGRGLDEAVLQSWIFTSRADG